MNARHSTYRPVRDTIALALIVALTGALALILAAGRAQASTATHTATPAAQACQAFGAWQQHPGGGTLGRLVVASTRLGRSYLKADIAALYADASSMSPKSAKYVPDDAQYVFQDCHNGYGA